MEKPYISFETDRLIIRTVEEADKEYYLDLRVATSDLAVAYSEFPEFRDHEWDGELNSTTDIYLSVFLKENRTFVASGSIQGFASDTLELGFDVDESCRNQGLATELVKGMIRMSHTVFPDKPIIIRTDRTNAACIRVCEKCGGVLSGFEPTKAAWAIANLMERFENKPTDDPELIEERKKNAAFIEENKEGVCVYRFE